MEDNKQQKVIKFEDIKPEIVLELNKCFKSSGITEPVTLVDGFVNQPVNMELTGSLVIGGPAIPMIMLLGNKSGRIYFFALKAILKSKDF